jgi:peroxiredoxin
MIKPKLRDILAVGAVVTGLVVMYSISSPGSSAVGTQNSTVSPDQVNSVSSDSSQSEIPFALNSASNAPVAPDFTLSSLDGHKITLSDAVKKGPVLIDFWATWCGPCRMELPHLSNVYDKYKDKGVQIYALNVDADAAGLKHFFSDGHPNCPILIDTNQIVGSQYGVNALPTMYLIDKNMHIRSVMEGVDPDTETDLPTSFNKLLQGA